MVPRFFVMHATTSPSARYPRLALCGCLFAALASPLSFGQSAPPSGNATSSKQQNTPQKLPPDQPSTESPELLDEPKFTVAGVADASSAGGHGSSTAVRTKEVLAKATASLSNGGPAGAESEAREKALRDVLARQPASFEANHELGKVLLDRSQPSAALTYLQRASQLNPIDYETGYDLARAHAAAGQYPVAQREAQALLFKRDQWEPHHLLAEISERRGDPLEAAREYQRAAELNPSEGNLFDWGAELLLHRAIEPSIKVFTKSSRLYPQSSRSLIGMAVALHARGSYDQAQQRLCEAADLAPEDPNPYLFMGRILNTQALASVEVSERLARFLKLRPEDPQANYFYALSLLNQETESQDKKLKQAEDLLEKTIRLDPDLTGAYLRLGAIASGRGDFARAIKSYSKAAAVEPQSPEAHYALAQAYSRTGEKTKAEEELRIYQRVSKDAAQQLDRERRAIKEFVVTLADQNSGAQPR